MPFKNIEDRIACSKKYYQDHKEHIKKKVTEYYFENWDIRNKQRDEWLRNNPEKRRLYQVKFESKYYSKEENKLKRVAHRAVQKAITDGSLIKKNSCEKCSKTECRIEGHHYLGYEPVNHLKVIWLCCKCHRHEDKLLRESKKQNI